MIPRTLACVALLIAGTAGASAQDYRAEIMEHVVDRCYRATVHFHAMIRAPDSPNLAGEDELVRMLKAAPHTERLVAALTETVRGKDHEQRTNLYDIAFVNCFVSGSEDIL